MRAVEFRDLPDSPSDLTPLQREALLEALEEGNENVVREVLQEPLTPPVGHAFFAK